MGATNTHGRIASSLGKAGPEKPHFVESVDIVNGGVMLAIPAFLHCDLLNHIEKHFELPNGYYDVNSIMLLLAFCALSRVPSIEHYLLLCDGTGFFSSEKVHCKNCCTKHHRNGKTTYRHMMLGAAIAHPDHKEVIPLNLMLEVVALTS